MAGVKNKKGMKEWDDVEPPHYSSSEYTRSATANLSIYSAIYGIFWKYDLRNRPS